MNIIYNKSDCKPAKVTIFSIPKPFKGHIGLIQRNAVSSWTQLTTQAEIILFGDEPGTKEICEELDLIHVPQIRRNKYGTPLLDGIFAETCDRASNNIIAYLNADIILTDDFLSGIQSVDEELENYLLIGRRWNIDLERKLNFDSNWQSNLEQLIKKNGQLADYDCKDYFVFPKHLFSKIPKFAVGRGYWDTWMVNESLSNNYPVVDCSLAVTAIHQNHPYTHIRGGRNEAYIGREAQINKSLGNVSQPGNIACATWQLKPLAYRDLPTVSIVIVAQAASIAIEKAVLSVLIQDYEDYEIIVVDRHGDRKIEAVLQTYQDKTRYFTLANQQQIDAYYYGWQMARGEFITFLNSNSVMLPKTLSKQVACWENEASTLDILLSGYRVIAKQKMTEHKPWDCLPDLENYYLQQIDERREFLNRSPIMFRHRRLNLGKDFNWTQRAVLPENTIELMSNRGCRASYLKLITENHYE